MASTLIKLSATHALMRTKCSGDILCLDQPWHKNHEKHWRAKVSAE